VVESILVEDPISKTPSKPVSVLAAFAAGFDRVAAKPILILPPLVLDLFLWFGPHLTLPFLVPIVPDGISALVDSFGADPAVVEQMDVLQQMLNLFIERYNLISALSSLPAGMPFNLLAVLASLPAGIPSLMAGVMPANTPIGQPQILEIGDLLSVVVVWAGLTVFGLGLGAFYHRWLAQQAAPKAEVAAGWIVWIRMVLLFLTVYIGGFLWIMFMVLLASIVGLLVPVIGTILLLIVLSLLFWAAVYMAFTAHGIVLYDFRVVKAMSESVRIVRQNLLSTAGFLFLCFFVTWLSMQVWVLPGDDSWYSLLALVGHAFVSATMLAASYIFYQSRRSWFVQMQASLADQATGGHNKPGLRS